MMNDGKARDLSGFDEWELELLFELRILREAGAMAPVLEAMASCLAALYLEGERLAWEKRHAKPVTIRHAGHVRYVPVQFIPNNEFARKIIAEQTASGRWISRLDREL